MLMEEGARLRQEQGSQLNQQIKGVMHTHYMKMKREAGLENASSSSIDIDDETEAVFKQLRPNANYKLMDILEGRVKQKKPKMFLSKHMRMHH